MRGVRTRRPEKGNQIMKYTKYLGWDWDIVPTELRLNDEKGTVMFRCATGVFEPPEDVKNLIANAPAMYEALKKIANNEGEDFEVGVALNSLRKVRTIAALALEGL